MAHGIRSRVVPSVLATAMGASALFGHPGAVAEESDPSTHDVVVQTLHVEVENVNRSAVACHSDGHPYVVRAQLAMPAHLDTRHSVSSVTLYVHGLGLSSYYWHFETVPGYDHLVEMARLGHVGVVYDRLGYGQSPKPLGIESCYGSDADVAAQLAAKLKSGDYTTDAEQPIAFEQVVVASHSQAGLIVQPMAYSFDDADALVITSWTDAQNRQQVAAEVVPTAQTCLTGGEQPPAGERPPFYAYFPKDPATFEELYFHNADPAVVEAATRLREPDPCGQGGSLPQTLVADEMHLDEIDVPVLLVYGTNDGYRPQPAAGQAHADRFTGSPDVTVAFLENTGNAIVLERDPARFRSVLGRWLCERGLAETGAACERASGPASTPSSEGEPRAAHAASAPVLPRSGMPPALLPAGLVMLGLGALGAGSLAATSTARPRLRSPGR